MKLDSYIQNHDIYELDVTDYKYEFEYSIDQFAYAYNDDELSALVSCLKVWIERDVICGKSTHLMIQSFLFFKEISSARLMAACKWFEEIPCVNTISTISNEDITQIAAVAAEKAASLGYDDITGRVSGVIRSLKRETNMQRISRLVNSVKADLDIKYLDEKFISAIEMALKYRGRIAHGTMSQRRQMTLKYFLRRCLLLRRFAIC